MMNQFIEVSPEEQVNKIIKDRYLRHAGHNIGCLSYCSKTVAAPIPECIKRKGFMCR